ncbi:NifB/NifX family molybdenum-iron cluster-binding protein [Desulforamulus hydrothermalis]|uniref:Dinitrogenase iron-molybdenum cofactor biosynthesis protein n=1 Tax=Desulforamulus hydrothermalis Lam5 = DSM 18033 TaxID=1121428 RepID=K8DXT5_9FIRM|nr:NifB/NifX family molybdenum-iron cluster-binding protein [Desulforamulus hydrothermalis]CCO07454.1 Dinitrogenase iron-molybdenum cofactor biosynthesis protein [Desulforamulus hydrothermalis Lam5 = DSM 18033]SHH18143.1 Predicted Fe-Mo cluster-binding protein, NifX family [Desulforamulus hydrothermalis Lam5 = DSM 18033]
MKIAVSSSGMNLEDALNPRLGRCEYFIIHQEETGHYTAIENTGRFAVGAAGIATAGLLNEQGVDVLITGLVGPNAFTALQAAGIRVFIGATGSVQQALQDYRAGKLSEAAGPNVGPHGR